MLRCVSLLAVVVMAVLSVRAAFGQFDEDADLIPGILAEYTAAEKSSKRIDVTLSHDWGEASPDERMSAGPFAVTWQSQLLQRQETAYQFHAYLQGQVEVQVDGEPVLVGHSDQPGWVSGDAVELGLGLLELQVIFRKTQPSAQVHLFWSSDEFPLEPVPPHLLFREEGRPDLAEWEQGRQLYAAHRCNRCHRRDDEPLSPPAPSLVHVTSGLDGEWLIEKLQNLNPSAAHDRMPSFEFTEEESTAIAAYLGSVAEKVELSALPEPKAPKKDEPDGDELLKSVGCLACHTLGDVGQLGPFSGGDLTAVGEKRTGEWFSQWLSNPAALNVDHRMPTIKLSDDERARIAAALASQTREGQAVATRPTSDPDDAVEIERGRLLVERARCAACHRIPGNEPRVENVPSLSSGEHDWDRSCVSSVDRNIQRPVYKQTEVDALRSYVDSRVGSLSSPSVWARGRSVLEERNCLACHERDLGTGIVPVAGAIERTDERFRGQSQALIPPSLTAVGDKLLDSALSVAIRGEQKSQRLPWLHVRMPQFQLADEDQQALLSFLIGHDRLPPDPPQTALSIEAQSHAADEAEQTLLTGHALAGAGAFNCVACHKFGDYEPRNVALGTKGCDLLLIGERMRSEFFHRWTRAPLRVVPGMEMPNFNKPVQGVLDDDVDRQLAALWRAINDPRFTTPTNPTQVEQLLIVQPNEPAEIVRDVFTVVPGNGGGFVARSFAIGFGNGHSLLFDLDQFAVRGWTLGDFARQRTEGKSWYWDLAGVDVMTGFDTAPGLVLRHQQSGEIIEPTVDGNRVARLVGYRRVDEHISLQHTMSFEVAGVVQETIVQQSFTPAVLEAEGDAGIHRLVTARELPAGYDLVLRQPANQPRLRNATITTGETTVAGTTVTFQQTFTCRAERHVTVPKPRPEVPPNEALVTTLPGMTGQRLPLPTSVMPTAMALTDEGRLVFTSLKGQVYETLGPPTDDPVETLTELEQGLSAPFGVLPFHGGLLVAHKPELLWLSRSQGSGGRVDRKVWADGWGFTDNYHDWVTGPVQDRQGNLYLALGSDYQQPERPGRTSRFRGKVLRVDAQRKVEPFAHELRFPQGIAFDGQDRLFVSDQQGVGNTFNEIDHIVEGRHYGVKSLHEVASDVPETRAAVQVPHPWTRSVNGIFFLPEEMTGPLAPFAGHGVGCEYNGKRLIRFSLQDVGGELQGACYDLSRPQWENDEQTFLGPICGTATSDGTLYVGSIFDSGWLGGPNTGEIVRLLPNGDDVPNGIREVRATKDGFEIEFLKPVDRTRALDPGHYVLSGYTRVWQGAYATPDSGQYTPAVTQVELDSDDRTVRLRIPEFREAYVYEINASQVPLDGEELFPSTAHYTMNHIPEGTTH